MQINLGARKIHCKIVYYGPGCSGKTTNIQKVHEHMPRERKSELTSIATEGDRTLFFDFMSLDLGQVMGMDTCFQLYTVPGQVYYNATRKLVLQGVDGLVFVADCSPERFEANVESWANLVENLGEYKLTLDDVPVVIQYNKRDVPGAVATEKINALINKKGFKTFESVACKGQGVLETLKAVCSMVIGKLGQKANERGAAKTAEAGPVRPVQPAAATRTVESVARAATALKSASTVQVVESAAEEKTVKPAATARPEGIAMVSLDYTAKAESVPAARTEGSVQSRPKGRSSTAANDALRKQFTGGRPTSVVKATGTPVVIGRIEPRRREPRIGWWLALGGLAAAAAIAGVILYLVRV